MATGFYRESLELDNELEPKVYTAPSPDFTNFSFTSSSTAMTDRYQAPPTNSWAYTVTTGYYSGGTSITACKLACFPTTTSFATVTSGSLLKITRSESYLTIGSTSYPKPTFRGNKIPRYIGVILVGGGGGGGGRGCDKGNKSGWNARCGGSGGGAGIGSFVLDVFNYNYWLTIGSGGSGGAGGSSDSRPSTGSNGGDGTNTTLWADSSGTTYVVYGMGGGGGAGGIGNSGDGNGGSGRNAYFNGTYENNRFFDKVNTTGSPGNHCQNGGSTALSLSRVFANVGQSSTSFFSWSKTEYYNGSSGNSYKDGYTCGGCSYGIGGRSSWNSNGTVTISPGYGAGGGGNGSGNGQAGGGGVAIFYY